MLSNTQIRIGAGLFLFLSGVVADTSLWIPGLDPQPISAGILGVGNDGKTTWLIQQGTTSAGEDPADLGFPGKATFVDGPSDAVFNGEFTAADEAGNPSTMVLTQSCVKSGSLAVCVEGGGGDEGSQTFTETETISPFSVQGGGFLAGASSGGAPSLTANSGSPTQTSSGGQASAGSSVSGGASPTNSATKDNGARRDSVSIITTLLGLAATSGVFYLM